MLFPAHIRGGSEIQSATEHSRNTAKYASQCLGVAGFAHTGQLLGLLHDCGKFKAEFANYIKDPHGVRGSVNHTFAGCRLLLEKYHGGTDALRQLTAEMAAVAVGSHHGLFDCVDEHAHSGFLHRMQKQDIGYEECVRNFYAQCMSEKALDALFDRSVKEIADIYPVLADGVDTVECSFRIGLLTRLLLSGLIEGDRRDTARFMGGFPAQELPDVQDLQQFWMPYLQRVEEKLLQFPADTPIHRARREISDRCRQAAAKEGGIYRLTVPTGGGKTLTALRYALAHAQQWSKQRLVFVSPLLSILEQNAAVIRSFLEDDGIVLEHHSNIVDTEERSELDHRELAVESWNAPVIITTFVQLLNTLFDGKTTSIRRFQGLCNSVIVIDEVQTVPPKMLSMFNLAMDFLAKICGATILLCSATQPCLEKTDHPIKSTITDLITVDEKLWAPFRRTVITDVGGKTLEEIGVFAAEQLRQTESLLVVCNRKDEAAYLFSVLRDEADMAVHLSASMCTAHRRDVLAKLKETLGSGKKCLCVATQVIEAGVDISFSRVIRLAAGLDSVIQAAGRCNRNGESDVAVPVYVSVCQGEKLAKLRDIRAAKEATETLLEMYGRNPNQFDQDLSSSKAIQFYYQRLYANMTQDYQNYAIEKPRTTLFDLLSVNEKFCDGNEDRFGSYFMRQAFKLAGSRFEVFDNATRDVIVPYGDGCDLIRELSGQGCPDGAFLAQWERRARAYSVAVYDWQLAALGNAVTEYAGICVLAESFYDRDIGLILRPGATDFLEV